MECIHKERACFSKGISKIMKQKFGFVNVAGGAYNDKMVDITSVALLTEYDPPAAAGA